MYVSADVTAMKLQCESMRFARFLSALLSSFDGARSQILGAKELPSLSKVFSRLCQTFLSLVAPPHANCPALATFVGPYRPIGSDFGCGGCDLYGGSDFSCAGRNFGRGGRDSNGNGRGQGVWPSTMHSLQPG